MASASVTSLLSFIRPSSSASAVLPPHQLQQQQHRTSISGKRLSSVDVRPANSGQFTNIIHLVESIPAAQLRRFRSDPTSAGNSLLHELVLRAESPTASALPVIPLLYRLVVHAELDINLQNRMGDTPLHLACFRPYGHLLVPHLMRLGAAPDLYNNAGFRVVVLYNNSNNSNSGSSLSSSQESEHLPACHAYLTREEPRSQCSLWQALRREHMDAINFFLLGGCWTRTIARRKRKSLHDVALETGNYAVLEKLIRARQTTELVMAALAGDVSGVKKLLAERLDKCDVNTKELMSGKPLLNEVIYVGRDLPEFRQIANLLIQHGAAPAKIYTDVLQRQSELFKECEFYRLIIQSSSSSVSPSPLTPSSASSWRNAQSIYKLERAWNLLDEKRVPVHLKSRDGETYLHVIVKCFLRCSAAGNLLIQRCLLRLMYKIALNSGLDIQARTKSRGKSVLHLAYPHRPLLDHLIRLGVDASLPCARGRTLTLNTYAIRGSYSLQALPASQARHPGLWSILLAASSTAVTTAATVDETEGGNTNSNGGELPTGGREQEERADKDSETEREMSRWLEALLCRVNAGHVGSGGGLVEAARNRNLQKTEKTLLKWRPLTEFVIGALAGDKHVVTEQLAMGGSGGAARKVNAAFKDHCSDTPPPHAVKQETAEEKNGDETAEEADSDEKCDENTLDPDGRWREHFVSRPLLVSLMELSPATLLQLLIERYGARLDLYYAESWPRGPIAFWAFRDDMSAAVCQAVAQHANIRLRDERGFTLLHAAAVKSFQLEQSAYSARPGTTLNDITRTLVNHENKDEARAPAESIQDKHARLIGTLLERHVNVALRDLEGRTARDWLLLHHQQHEQQKEQQKDLPASSSSSRSASSAKRLAQIIDDFVLDQVFQDKLEAVEQLILDGYDHVLDVRSSDRHMTAMELAQLRYLTEMTTLLLEAPHYRKQIVQLQLAVITGDHTGFIRLLNERRAVLGLDARGRNLLHLAVLYRRHTMIGALCERTPELANQGDCLMRTPVHYAVCLRDQRATLAQITQTTSVALNANPDANNLTPLDYIEKIERPASAAENRRRRKGRRVFDVDVSRLVRNERSLTEKLFGIQVDRDSDTPPGVSCGEAAHHSPHSPHQKPDTFLEHSTQFSGNSLATESRPKTVA